MVTLLKWVVLALCVSVVGCTGSASPPGSAGGIDLSQAHLVDLTHPYDESTLYWPTSPSRFALTTLDFGLTPGGYFYAANAFSTPEHGGTHIDAPLHFGEGKWTVGEIPVRSLVGPGVVLDVSAAAAENRDYRLTRQDVEAWEKANGAIPQDAIVLLRTGWSRFWPDAKTYLGDDTPGDASHLHFPSYGEDAAQLLVAERRVAGLGIDTASIDYGPSTDFMAHRIACAANVYGLENVTNLEELPAKGFWVIALPVKIARGSGSPVRIIAVIAEGGVRAESGPSD